MSLTSSRLIPLLAAAALAAPACTLDGSALGPGGDDDAGDQSGPDGSSGGKTDGPGGGGDPDGSGPDGSGGDPDGSGGDPDGSGEPDAPIPDSAPPPDAAEPPPEGPYQLLSQSGLYSDIATHTVAADLVEFEPEFKLWSDGAEKQRWIRLPAGLQINSENMGRWTIPRGTTAWKEFRDPVSGKRLETRIIQRLESGAFYFASFIWNEDDSEAVADATPPANPPVDIPAGCSECASPPCTSFPAACHVVPRADQCNDCHDGEGGRLLGFSAVQLSHDGPGMTLPDLVDLDVLTTPPPDGETYPVPGTAVERAAIGSLHANCGHCHSPPAGQLACFSLTQFEARVLPGDLTAQDTRLYQTAVDQPLAFWVGTTEGNFTFEQTGQLITDRIVPGDFERSAIWYRMSVREWGELPPFNDHQQMPIFATNEVDEEGLAAVEVWINSLQ